jgi:hypothetical protein
MKHFVITPAMGKRLIGKGMAAHPAVQAVLRKGTLAIIAGSTNGYVAEEILSATGQGEGFSRRGFRRGAVVPPGREAPIGGGDFPGDVVLTDGVWRKGKTIFDVADDLSAGDVILKGANALDLVRRRAAILVGDRNAGTAGAAIRAVYGRRARMIVPVGLEKRVADDLADLAAEVNAPEGAGPRLLPLPGEVFTELDAIRLLTGATARLLAAGGVAGAEGAAWVLVTGRAEDLESADKLLRSVSAEPPCQA